MTGNNKVWRAPLAGLAAVAMLATMGVAASTANAAGTGHHDVSGVLSVSGVWAGESVAEAALRNGTFTPSAYGYYSDSAKTKAFKVTSEITDDTVTYGDTTGAANYVPVTLDLDADSAQVVDGVKATSNTTVQVKKGSKVGVLHSVADAANYKLVTKWTATFVGSKTVTTDYDSPEDVVVPDDATSVTIAPKAGSVVNASVVRFASPWGSNAEAHLKGALIDGGGDVTAYTVDAAAGANVNVPTAVYNSDPNTPVKHIEYWQDAKGNKVTGATVKADGDTTYTAVTTDSDVFVTFNSNGGSAVAPARVKTDKTIDTPKEPTREGFDFVGWEFAPVQDAAGVSDYVARDGGVVKALSDGNFVIADFTGVYFNRGTVLNAVWAPTYDVKVTFHYGDYANAPEDKTETFGANDFVTEPEAPTREGYVFDGWFLSKDTNFTNPDADKFNFDTQLAKDGNNGANFTLYAHWHRAYDDEAQNALNYVQSKDYSDSGLGVNTAKTDDADYFTKASWDKFQTVYKKAYQQYKAARQLAPEVDSKTAGEIVSSLSDAWKDLRFSSEYADTTLDGKHNPTVGDHKNTAQVVYRLSAGSARHLLTGDEVEVKALTNKYVGQGGWSLDATTFRTVNNLDENGKLVKYKWVEGKDENSNSNDNEFGDGTGFEPLLKEVSRLYNGREHMYTSDQVEIDALVSSGKWTKDSNLASFYVPAQYTTSTRIVRLY
ncbi:hypothetical protein COO72_11725, partial [Bifidobacterium callitrichos]